MTTGLPSRERVRWWWGSRLGRRLVIETGLVLTLLMAYRRIRLITAGDLREGFRNAREIIGFERWMGLTIEDDLQRLLLEVPELVKFLNHYYVWFHFPVAIALFVWLYWRQPQLYGSIRTLMAVVTFSALAIHLVYPLAPPRLMPGFVDTMMQYGPRIYGRNLVKGAANQIAAMPSLHFGWAVIAAMAVVRAWRHPLRWLVLVHPTLMAVAIVATGNHWWIDAAVAGVIILVADRVQRAVAPRWTGWTAQRRLARL